MGMKKETPRMPKISRTPKKTEVAEKFSTPRTACNFRANSVLGVMSIDAGPDRFADFGRFSLDTICLAW